MGGKKKRSNKDSTIVNCPDDMHIEPIHMYIYRYIFKPAIATENTSVVLKDRIRSAVPSITPQISISSFGSSLPRI